MGYQNLLGPEPLPQIYLLILFLQGHLFRKLPLN